MSARGVLRPAFGSYPHRADLDLIAFEPGASTQEGSFELTADLTRHDGVLYGGTGAAATVMAMEAATQRDATWVVTQFVAPARTGDRIRWVAQTVAEGRYVAQVQVTATVGDRLVFCGLGASGHPRPDGLTGQFETMPAVTPPEDSPSLGQSPTVPTFDARSVRSNMELREATFGTRRPAGRVALWARLTAGADLTRAGLAYLADRVPMAITRAAGRRAPGVSLDNCVRFAALPSTQWVLFDLRGQVASLGYGHGSFTTWSQEGALLACGSQSATMTRMRPKSPRSGAATTAQQSPASRRDGGFHDHR